jgi:Lon protease-like protein
VGVERDRIAEESLPRSRSDSRSSRERDETTKRLPYGAPSMRVVARATRWLIVVVAVVAAIAVHRQAPWISAAYLAALIALPVAAWWVWRRGRLAGRWRRPATAAAVLAFVALCPVPWMKLQAANPPGTAWQLDGRLVLDGHTVDPPGTWYWLTAGRPPIVAEVVRSWFGGGPAVRDLHDGPVAQRPTVVEPAAAAVGLRLAGHPSANVHAAIGVPFAGSMPVSWFRHLSLGRSHGLMVALVSYVDSSGEDLARGRAIAGTGGINGDGTVRPIAGLRAKATAARRVGADVLLFPAGQEADLAGFDAGSMRLVPVTTISEAVAALSTAAV